MSEGNSIIPTEQEHDAHYCPDRICDNCGEKFNPHHFEDDQDTCQECLNEQTPTDDN